MFMIRIEKLFKKVKRVITQILFDVNARRLIFRYKNDRLSFRYLRTLKYGVLLRVMDLVSEEVYFNIHCLIENEIIKNLKKKEKVRVCFICMLDSFWSCDCLYDQLGKSVEFEPYIVIWPTYDEKTNQRTRGYYNEKGYNVCEYTDLVKDEFRESIFFYFTVYSQKEESGNIEQRRMDSLIAIIPYTFWYDECSNTLLSHRNAQLAWRIYCPTAVHMQLGQKLNLLGRKNLRYSGYPKMDNFYKGDCQKAKWKSENSQARRIIYAPGYYFVGDSNFSTFEMNGNFFLEYAKNHASTTSWIIRPHPVMGQTLVNAGIYESLIEYENYLEAWRRLGNADVSIGGEYYNLFRSSDALITDSISFLSGYQYTGKPLLLLQRNNCGEINEYGEKLVEVLYKTNGDNYREIERFISDVVCNNNDDMLDLRKNFFECYLDYNKQNGMLANDYIFSDIEKTVAR